MIKTITTKVTDTNNRPAGSTTIIVDFGSNGPDVVIHNRAAYVFTGKAGTHLATGVATREMATDSDARLWITLDGLTIWED